jgi:hypothetical protein
MILSLYPSEYDAGYKFHRGLNLLKASFLLKSRLILYLSTQKFFVAASIMIIPGCAFLNPSKSLNAESPVKIVP